MLGVVGESGAGKSLTGGAIVGLLERPGRIAGGEIGWTGSGSTIWPPEPLRRIRGRRIGMIFQDPLTTLNPLYTIGRQLTETMQTHAAAVRRRGPAQARLAGWTGSAFPPPAQRIDAYPHEFSGGQRQRVVIALALCAEPALVIADEPTTALDVSIQAQIITLLKDLTRDHGTAVMLITHDMGVIAETADRVAVMYAGRIAEIGPVAAVIRASGASLHRGADGQHPVAGAPGGPACGRSTGAMPRLDAMPAGCRFHPRCPRAFARCRRNSRNCWMRGRRGPPAGCTPMAEARMLEAVAVSHFFDVSRPFAATDVHAAKRGGCCARWMMCRSPSRAARTFALVGESGCGKSTIARLAVGLYRTE